MEDHNLGEVDLQQGEQSIRIRRGAEGGVPLVTAVPAPVAAPAETAAAAPMDDANITLIKSPMVGTFYTAASPESPAYVKVGDPVGPESTVCIIEAMKVFNEIPAETSGQIVTVLVDNQDYALVIEQLTTYHTGDII